MRRTFTLPLFVCFAAATLILGSVVPAAAQYYFNPYSVWNAPNFRPYPWVNTTPSMPYNVDPQVSGEPAQAQTTPRWWCPGAHAYYPQVTFCQIGTWEAVYPPPSPPQVSQSPTPQVTRSPPSQVTEEPVTGKEQFRCRDPNTNFVYERPEPCAKGDEILSRSGSSPSAPAQDHAALCHHIDEQFALCSIAAGNQAAMIQQQWKAEIAQGQMVSDAEQNALGDLFKPCQKYSDAHDQNGCPPER